MSEFKEVDDRKFGQYVLNSSDLSGIIDAEELANACRRLGISGPLEPLLRDLKIKNEKYVSPSSPAKDSPRKTSQRKEKRTSSANKQQTKQSPEFPSYEPFDSKGNSSGSAGGGFGKNSYGKESWGRDSGARDLSPEPNMHRMHETLSNDNQPMDTETGGTSAMLHLASKVSINLTLIHSINQSIKSLLCQKTTTTTTNLVDFSMWIIVMKRRTFKSMT